MDEHAATLSRDPDAGPTPPRRRLPRWLLPIVLALAFAGGLLRFLDKDTSELPVYVQAAERLLADQRMHVATDPKPFTYPPFFALPFVPFTWLPGETAQRTAWYCLNVLALVWIVRVLHRHLSPLIASPRRVWFWVLCGALSLRHVSAVFENQSHDLLVFAAVLLGFDAAVRVRWLRSALWLGAAAAMKATPLLFVPYLLLRRRVLAAALVPIVFLAASLLPELVGRSSTGEPYLVDWYRTFLSGMNPVDPDAPATAQSEGAWSAWNYLNQSLGGTLYRLGTPVEPGLHRVNVALAAPDARTLKLLTQGAQLLVLLGTAIAIGWRRRAGSDGAPRLLAEFGLIACGMLLLSPMSSKSHFCVLLLPYAALALAFVSGELPRWSRLLVLLLVALNWATTRGVVGKDSGAWLLAIGAVTWITVLTAVLAGVLLRRPQAADAPLTPTRS